MSARNTIVPEQYKNKPIYSFSRLNTFNTCEHEFYLGYILSKPKKPNIYTVLGSEVHSILEGLMRNEISNEEAVILFQQKVLECDILGITFPSEKIKSNFLMSIEHYLQNYKPIPCKDFKLEMEFYTSVGQSDTCILGYIDLIALRDNGDVEIYDYKTSTIYDKKALKEHGRQLLLYALALKKNYNTNVNKVAFNFLKYVDIEYFNGKRVKKIRCQRNAIIKTLYDYLLDELFAIGKIDFEVELLLTESSITNTISNLPQEVKDKFTFNDCLVECSIDEESIKDLEDFVDSTVSKINSKDKNYSSWQPLEIERNSFYCNTLCSYRGNICEYHKQYLEEYNNSKEEHNFIKNIFG
jgi:hypothetical protein